MFTTIPLQRFLIGLAVFTAFGVMVHDTKLDQATTIALSVPVGMTLALAHMPELRSEGHTHVERVAFDKAQLVTGLPRVQPRDDRRRFVLPKHESDFGEPEQHTMVLAPALA